MTLTLWWLLFLTPSNPHDRSTLIAYCFTPGMDFLKPRSIYNKLFRSQRKYCRISPRKVCLKIRMILIDVCMKRLIVHVPIPPDMNVWKEHYLQQLAHNQQLEAQLKQLDRKVTELKNQVKEGVHHRDNTEQGYEGMSDVTMRHLLRKLEKEKAEIEWQLKECEWRLDQEAAVSAGHIVVLAKLHAQTAWCTHLPLYSSSDQITLM